MRSHEQEEYIIWHGHRESALVEADTIAVIEWTCELKSEHPHTYKEPLRISSTLSERPPLPGTGYQKAPLLRRTIIQNKARWLVSENEGVLLLRQAR